MIDLAIFVVEHNIIDAIHNDHRTDDGQSIVRIAVGIHQITDFGVDTYRIRLLLGQMDQPIIGIHAQVQFHRINILIFNILGIQVTGSQRIQIEDIVFIHILPFQSTQFHTGIDHESTDIHCRIVIGIRNHSDNQISTDCGVGQFLGILEGQLGLLRQLLQNGLKVGEDVQLITCSLIFSHNGFCLLDQCNQIGNPDAVGDSTALCQDLIDPIREVNVDVTGQSSQAVLTEGAVGSDLRRNNGSVRIYTGIGGNRNHVADCNTVAVMLVELLVHFDGSIRRLDDQCTNADTNVGNQAVITTEGIGGRHSVSTCMGRCSLACIGNTVCLNTGIVDGQVAIVLSRSGIQNDIALGMFLSCLCVGDNNLIHCMRLVIECKQPVVIHSAGLIIEGDI